MIKRIFPSKVIVLFIFLFASVASAAAATETETAEDSLRISKVRIVIDDNEYVWTENGSIENFGDAADQPKVKPETVISFLGFSPGDNVTPKTLDRYVREAELRLIDSGYYYAATVVIIPPRASPSQRTILVSLTSGFFGRYGGGASWGMIGQEAIGGKRMSLKAYLGWNKNGLELKNVHTGGIPIITGLKTLWYGPGNFSGKTFEDGKSLLESTATIGWMAHPDLTIALDGVLASQTGSAEAPGVYVGDGLFSLQPHATLRRYLPPSSRLSDAVAPSREVAPSKETPPFSDFALRGYWYPSLQSVKLEGTASVHFPVLPLTVLALRLTGGISPEHLPSEAYFDLYFTDDRNVRSGYEKAELTSPSFVLGSAEVRVTPLTFVIPPMLKIAVELFTFADIAGLSPGTDPNVKSYANAFGGGARILFDNPVFASFTFSYGINDRGDGRFLFAATAGY